MTTEILSGICRFHPPAQFDKVRFLPQPHSPHLRPLWLPSTPPTFHPRERLSFSSKVYSFCCPVFSELSPPFVSLRRQTLDRVFPNLRSLASIQTRRRKISWAIWAQSRTECRTTVVLHEVAAEFAEICRTSRCRCRLELLSLRFRLSWRGVPVLIR